MAIINDPDQLSQGLETAVADMRFSSPTGAQVTITSALSSLPTITAGDYFEIRGAINPENDGLYLEDGGSPTTGSVTASKVGGSAADPQASAVDNTAASVLHDDGTESEEKSVFFDTIKREIWLIPGQGSLTGGINATDTGVILQFLYSFTKEEWKNDNTLIVHPFPFTAITPEQFELNSGWTFHRGSVGKGTTYEATQLIRTGGFREVDIDGTLNTEFASIVSLGLFEDSTNDKAYFQQGDDITDTTAPTDFSFFGPLNEVVKTYEYQSVLGDIAIAGNGTNNTITSSGASVVNFATLGFKVGGQITVVSSDTAGDLTAQTGGTYTIESITTVSTTNDRITLTNGLLANDATNTTFTAAVNNRNILNIFLREPENGGDTNGKTFGFSDLAAIGADTAGLDNKVFRFPLTNATDLNIEEEDPTIASTDPWQEIEVRYFNTNAFTRDVDDESGSNPRSYGIVIDVGTSSGVDGVSNGTTTFSTTDSPWLTDGSFDNGTLTIHEGLGKGTYTIDGVVSSSTSLTLTTTITADTNASFTIQRATPIQATLQQIFEAIQYQLRQNSDINLTNVATNNVTGSLASELLFFVGPDLTSGSTSGLTENPVPSSAGNGVIIEGFRTDDINNLSFVANDGVAYQFPFVTTLNFSFNDNLFSSGGSNDGKFWLFFQYTKQFNVSNSVTIGTPSNGAAQFTVSSGAVNFPSATLAVDDYLDISGFPTESNNGLWRVESIASATDITLFKVDGDTIVAESSTGIIMRENPINSPQTIVVNDDTGTPIALDITAANISKGFAYTTNAQGGRTVAGANSGGTPGGGDNVYDAVVVGRAIGLQEGQFVETTPVNITRASAPVAISFVAAKERNYSDPV